MRKRNGKQMKKYQTKHRMFLSYVLMPLSILLAISIILTLGYYQTSKKRILAFESKIAENVDDQLKNIMDNLLTSASQYSMTPWVKRLKYMQKIPDMMEKNIAASDISDYAGSITLTEINDSIVESIYIYYSIGGFGISSYGKSDWQKYVSVCQIESDDEAFLSGEVLTRNNQRTIFHNVSMMRNNKDITGFCLIQTIPLENSYSGEVNILFFVPYENIGSYLEKFTDDGTGQLYLTDGSTILYAIEGKEQQLFQGDSISELQMQESGFYYERSLGRYISEYTKGGMEIGVVQILDPDFLHRDFYAFLRWIIAGCLLLFGMIIFIAWHMTKYNYQPMEHIMALLDEQEDGTVDEYALIEKAIRELDSRKQRLDVAVYEQNPLIEQYLMHNLLNAHRMTPEEMSYINTMRQYRMFRVLVLGDSMEAKQYVAEIDAALAVYPQIHAAFLKEDRSYIWILSYGEENLVDEIADILRQTFEELEYRNAALGLSAVHEDIREAAAACSQAVTALKYHFFWPDKLIVRYEEEQIERRESSAGEFGVTEQERVEIKEALNQMNAEVLTGHYRMILLRNFRDCLLSRDQWFDGIHRLNEHMALMVNSKNQMNLNEQMELMEPENFGSLESYLQTFSIRLTNLMERSQIHENPLYSAKNQVIRQYVDSHLTDANLSLNETARVMHYTSTYFGKYFKEQFGCAFQQYVAVRRIERAKEYLDSDPDGKKMSISDIALACGFTNDVTFRRTFKRYTGVTPSQFVKGGIGYEEE